MAVFQVVIFAAEGRVEAGGVGIVMKSECAKKNKNKREDKGVLNHGGESGDSHANAFRWINIYFLIQKDCQYKC